MPKLIIVPQLKIHMRYQDWWSWALPKGFETYFDKVICLDLGKEKYKVDGQFSLVKESINFEFEQVKKFFEVYQVGDYVLVCDLSFPGFFHNVLFHSHIPNAYCICHATALNNLDYFNNVSSPKKCVEYGHSQLYKKIFVATEYHKDKIIKGMDCNNIVVTGLPRYPFTSTHKYVKGIDIISVARNSVQKIAMDVEDRVEKELDIKIIRSSNSLLDTWGNYFEFINKSKIMLITSREETFGYQVLDAVYNNCIPVAPRAFSYPELLPDEYLYSNTEELISVLKAVLGWFKVGKGSMVNAPNLLNQNKIDNFYHTVSDIILSDN